MNLQIIPGTFAVCKLNSLSGITLEDSFWFLSRTDEEISLVCRETAIPADYSQIEKGWNMFRISGVLDFSLTGILASLSQTLADANIGIFAVSTYNTDYILVKTAALPQAVSTLQNAGHTISTMEVAI